MPRKARNTHGGGAKTNQNGLTYEEEVDVLPLLEKEGFKYEPESGEVKYKNRVVAYLYYHAGFYKWLKEKGVDYKEVNSKRYTPDITFINLATAEANIFEVKFQETAGSVDAKIQASAFNKYVYSKLYMPIGYEVKYRYVLNGWYEKPMYEDTLAHIINTNCSYTFEKIPLDALKLDLLKTLI